jgi:hypothetical protein
VADPTPPDYLRWLPDKLEELSRSIRALQTADGTQTFNAVDKVKQLITDFRAELDEYLSTLDVYTKAETDERIGSTPGGVTVNGDLSATGNASITGNASAVDVNASGRVTSTAAIRSMGSRTLVVATDYAGLWVDGATGDIGISPSSIRFKTDLEQWQPSIERLLLLRAVLFRYDPMMLGNMSPDAPKQLGFIAEELEALGFHEFIFYEVLDTGERVPQGINYDRLSVALLVLAQHQDERIRHIEDHLGL